MTKLGDLIKRYKEDISRLDMLIRVNIYDLNTYSLKPIENKSKISIANRDLRSFQSAKSYYTIFLNQLKELK